MQILPITSNFNIYKNSKINNKISNPVSFRGMEEDINDWCFKFRQCINPLEPSIPGELRDKVIDGLFDKLKNYDQNTQERIILGLNLDEGYVFPLALKERIYAAEKIWNFVKGSGNKNLQEQFLLGPTRKPVDTPLYMSICSISSLPRDIIKFICSSTDEAFKERLVKLCGEKGTLFDYLAEREAYEFATIIKKMEEEIYRKNKRIDDSKFNKLNKQNNVHDFITSQKNSKSDRHYKPILSAETNNNFKVYQDVKTRFSDVGGMFNVKRQIENELLAILDNPKVKNIDKPSGILLYGPPGTGKSLLATAIAGEAGVPFIATEGSSFVELYVGVGPKKVRELYAEARYQAQNHPSKTAIVFIDEVDAVGGKRGESSNSERDNTLNALLCEMDGVKSKENTDVKVITILATNRKDMLDYAFRKGRIDLEFKIDDPRFSEKARLEILSIHAKDKPFKDEETKNSMLKDLAKTTAGFSGAELADVIKRAYRKTLYLGRTVEYITQDDINNAKLESMVGIKTDSEESEYEKKTMIAHEAGHAVNLVIMDKVFENEQTLSKRPVRVLDLVVNEPRGGAAGMTVHKPSEVNTGRYTIESLISSLVVTYGGYSTEESLFGCHTDGVRGDLESNTKKICEAVTKYGLGSKTKYLSVQPDGVMFELYKNDIKKDVEIYSSVSMKISNMISTFIKPFIEEYIQKYLNSSEKIIPGSVFIKMFETWLEKENKQNEFEQLKTNIFDEISQVRKKMES